MVGGTGFEPVTSCVIGTHLTETDPEGHWFKLFILPPLILVGLLNQFSFQAPPIQYFDFTCIYTTTGRQYHQVFQQERLSEFRK